MLRTLTRAAAALFAATSLSAQVPGVAPTTPERDALHAPARDVDVSLLTMGNGSEVWEMFGHAAIWIRDRQTGRDTVVNWGTFNRSQPNFIPHFLQGLMLYSVGGDNMSYIMYMYRYLNRSVTSQELNLSDAQKDTLLTIIRTNFQPENVNYRYDYFVDNCATRPRDILNRVLGGQLRVGADSITNTSYRWHALRLMQGDKPLVLGVNIGLGEPSDRPITKWQEMFLPQKLHDWVATRMVRDSTGALRPLVKADRVLFQANRPSEPAAPPTFIWLWPIGIMVAGLFVWLGRAALNGGRAARVGAAIVFGTWATVSGLLGLLLTALWAVTDHRFAHANENLLLFNPVWLVLAVLLPMFFLKRKAASATWRTVQFLTVLAVIALVVHIVPISKQTNLPLVGLALPISLALSYLVARADSVRSAHSLFSHSAPASQQSAPAPPT